jgi:hypothetical protein
VKLGVDDAEVVGDEGLAAQNLERGERRPGVITSASQTLNMRGERGRSKSLPSIMQRAKSLPKNKKLPAAAAQAGEWGEMGIGNKPRGADTN